MTDALELDAVIFGGGAAGLWTLDELVCAGAGCLLLEAHDLGSGQTVASQGIIHGGVKYMLGGLFTASAQAITDMPLIWRRCLSGEAKPNLSATRLRSHHCFLWQTSSLKSRVGMMGARAGLRIRPQRLAPEERPPILARCPGVVARLHEQVIEPWSFISDSSEQHRARMMKVDIENGLEFARFKSEGVAGAVQDPHISRVRLINPDTGEPLDLRPRMVVLTAGAGNQRLRVMCGLPGDVTQRRPLHMVMLRGRGNGANLPILNGHCIDGSATRVTITTTRDFSERLVWQVGGQIAERGVAMDEQALVRHARAELRAVLPEIDLNGVEWATYRADRAEAANAGARPSDVAVRREGNVITGWPTKLALVPRLATEIREMIGSTSPTAFAAADVRSPGGWPRPVVALPPWETTTTWINLD